MTALLAPKLALARAAGAVARLRGSGGTSLPGKLLVAIEPNAISELASRLTRGSVLISATNGKTTTATLTAGILRRSGISLVHNQAGANMAGGVASTLLGAARTKSRIDGELGLFEVDEFWLDRLIEELSPQALLLGNLFRDQLDRYGELDTIAQRWGTALESAAGQKAQLVCNADDPILADLGRERETLFFGIEDDSLSLPGMSHAADAKHCRRCGEPYVFDAIYLGHLGHYHCASCGQRRPTPSVYADQVVLEGVRGARFRLSTATGTQTVKLALPGVYNVYNALGAAALATAMGIPLATIVEGLQGGTAAFGRGETLTLAGRSTHILLVKNPAGANEVLRTLALEPGEHDLLAVLNDRTADGHDVSWIWDADFELLAGRVRRVVCSGTRAAELALRFKYAGVEPSRIEVIEDLAEALDNAVAGVEPGRALYVLPTYTAMLALRERLVKRGEASSSWL